MRIACRSTATRASTGRWSTWATRSRCTTRPTIAATSPAWPTSRASWTSTSSCCARAWPPATPCPRWCWRAATSRWPRSPPRPMPKRRRSGRRSRRFAARWTPPIRPRCGTRRAASSASRCCPPTARCWRSCARPTCPVRAVPPPPATCRTATRSTPRRSASTTTLALTADAVHARGLEEVARILAEMHAIKAQTGFDGDLPAFLHFLRTDPRFYARTPQELLAHASWIAKRIDGLLPRYFRRAAAPAVRRGAGARRHRAVLHDGPLRARAAARRLRGHVLGQHGTRCRRARSTRCRR